MRKNTMKKMMKKIFEFFRGEKIPDYPNDFAIVNYSEDALKVGIKNNQNKFITRYYYNQYGYLQTRTYPFSEPRVFAFKSILRIPVLDKTQKEPRFPVYHRISPSEVKFLTR